MAFQIIQEGTLSAIVNNVAAMVGYPAPADPAGSTDPAVQQFVQAANMAGQELLSLSEWQELTRTYDMPIVASTPGIREESYTLPEDFYDWIDQTSWNSTMQWPAVGPISPQQWQALKVRQTLPTLSFYWQVRDNKIWILSPPTSSQTLTFFYQSLAWVVDADDPTLYKNRLVKNSDRAVLDPSMMTLFARVKWLEMKGLDSGAAMRDFQVAYEHRKAQEKGAAILNMAQRHIYPFLSAARNLPDTGIGL